MSNRHSYKKFAKIPPVNNWTNIAKLLTISIFITAFGVASPKAAHAFRSSVDACFVKPDCAAALGLELLRIMMVKSNQVEWQIDIISLLEDWQK